MKLAWFGSEYANIGIVVRLVGTLLNLLFFYRLMFTKKTRTAAAAMYKH